MSKWILRIVGVLTVLVMFVLCEANTQASAGNKYECYIIEESADTTLSMSLFDTAKVLLHGNFICEWEILNLDALAGVRIEKEFFDTTSIDTGVSSKVFVLTKQGYEKDSLSFGYVCDQPGEEAFYVILK